MEFKEQTTEDFTSYLERQGLSSDIVDVITKNRLTAATFLELSSEHLKELFPIVGDRISVSKLLQDIKQSLGNVVQ